MEPVALYHVVRPNEDFDHAAQALLDIVRLAEEKTPSAPRILYLDVEGHRNDAGGFDHDMHELQSKFMCEFLSQFLTECHFPLGTLKTTAEQINEIPERLQITTA